MRKDQTILVFDIQIKLKSIINGTKWDIWLMKTTQGGYEKAHVAQRLCTTKNPKKQRALPVLENSFVCCLVRKAITENTKKTKPESNQEKEKPQALRALILQRPKA